MIKLFSRLGLPMVIRSDLGSSFKSELLTKFENELGVKSFFSTPYHHQSLSSAERYVGTLKNMLRNFVSEDPRSWDKMIDLLMFTYREVPCVTTGFSTFELMYGRNARGPLQVVKEELTQQAVSGKRQSVVKNFLDLRERLKQCSELASEHAMTLQVKIKTYYDKNSRQRSLAAGQRVFVLLPDSNNSLLCNWQGPYTVLRKVNDRNYEIDLGHRVTCLHINLLRLCNKRTDAPAVWKMHQLCGRNVCVCVCVCLWCVSYSKNKDIIVTKFYHFILLFYI